MTTNRTLVRNLFATTILALSVAGCNRGPSLSGTVSVSGTVTYNGTPLAGANVGFIPKDPEGKAASGLTDADGKFQLSTYLAGSTQASGALPGDYEVSVSKYETSLGFDPATGQSKMPQPTGKVDPATSQGHVLPGGGMMAPPKQLVPAKYVNSKTSGFTATVKPSGNDPFNFELTD